MNCSHRGWIGRSKCRWRPRGWWPGVAVAVGVSAWGAHHDVAVPSLPGAVDVGHLPARQRLELVHEALVAHLQRLHLLQDVLLLGHLALPRSPLRVEVNLVHLGLHYNANTYSKEGRKGGREGRREEGRKEGRKGGRDGRVERRKEGREE